jgi:hypothetical protein
MSDLKLVDHVVCASPGSRRMPWDIEGYLGGQFYVRIGPWIMGVPSKWACMWHHA